MRRALALLLAGATFIALSPIFVRLSEAGPIATAFWRTALALPALWPLYFARSRVGPPVTPSLLLFLAGLAFAGDLAFWHAAIVRTSVANSTLLANLSSLFVTAAAWAFLGLRPSRLFVAGLGAALAGVVLLVQSSLRFSASGVVGDVFGVVTALFYAAYLLVVKALRDRGCGTALVMAVTSSITTLALLPVALASGERILPVTPAGWLDLVGLALISHAAGQGLIAYALAHLPAAFSSVTLLLQPVMAALFAWGLLGEPLSALQLVAGAMVLAGIYLARRGSS
jgi:drug/metabolite transporter (DMT)-like permease